MDGCESIVLDVMCVGVGREGAKYLIAAVGNDLVSVACLTYSACVCVWAWERMSWRDSVWLSVFRSSPPLQWLRWDCGCSVDPGRKLELWTLLFVDLFDCYRYYFWSLSRLLHLSFVFRFSDCIHLKGSSIFVCAFEDVLKILYCFVRLRGKFFITSSSSMQIASLLSCLFRQIATGALRRFTLFTANVKRFIDSFSV